MRFILLIATSTFLIVSGPIARAADGLFAPRIIVNDQAITNFEVEQRVLFLKAVNTAGDLDTIAVRDLIEDSLKRQAASQLGLELTEDEIKAGLAEFAGRANLSVEEFTTILAEEGVAPETFRDFVKSGLIWRSVVRKNSWAWSSFPKARSTAPLQPPNSLAACAS